MHWGGWCAAPNEFPNTGPDDAPKGESPGLGGGVHAFFCLVSGLQCVGGKTQCMDIRAMAMQYNASFNGRDVGPRDVP